MKYLAGGGCGYYEERPKFPHEPKKKNNTLRTIWSILVSMLKPRHTTYISRETGKILYHVKHSDRILI